MQFTTFSSSTHNYPQSHDPQTLHTITPASYPIHVNLSPSRTATTSVADSSVTTGVGSGRIARLSSSTSSPSMSHHTGSSTTAFLRPRIPFKLASYNVRTLMRVGQQVGLTRTLESIEIDVCCLSETRIQDSSSTIRLTSLSDPKETFHLRVSGDPEASASGQAGVGVALSTRAEAALLDWIPVNSRLCAVRLEGSCRVNRQRSDKRCLFVISVYAPTDCSPDAVKDDFYHHLHNLLRKAPKTDIVILAGDLNARVGRLSPDEVHLGGRYGLDSSRSDNGDRLLSLCSDHRLFLVSTNFRHRKLHSATWRSPSSAQTWTQFDNVAISYR